MPILYKPFHDALACPQVNKTLSHDGAASRFAGVFDPRHRVIIKKLLAALRAFLIIDIAHDNGSTAATGGVSAATDRLQLAMGTDRTGLETGHAHESRSDRFAEIIT